MSALVPQTGFHPAAALSCWLAAALKQHERTGHENQVFHGEPILHPLANVVANTSLLAADVIGERRRHFTREGSAAGDGP